ncbi:hypothetical protein N7492_006949 [Penicillium capsulatum]|uniref:Lysine-specific metallo-endopeptidase domain-containing protein n=1 Tax=Penicillium capsulatum TaxID=69766 RepID=A0A9W9HYY0_9EURO|nr:hypothetical protein N7492_006949 [Penicillium capsulatum]
MNLLILVLSFLVAFAWGKPTIQDVFHLKTGNTKGGCDNRLSLLNTWFDEVKDMAQAGLQAFTDAGNGNKIAAGTLSQFLGITSKTSANEFKDVKAFLEEVHEFYQQGLDFQSGTPWLFCGSGWLERKERDDYSQDSDGDIKHEPVDCGDGDMELEPVEIQNDPAYTADLWQYVFEEDYRGRGYCSFTNSLAGTQTNTKPTAIDLCPKAFNNPKGAQSLGSRAPTKDLPDILPRSATLFHETFHLVHGNADAPDASYDISTLLKALEYPKRIPKSTNLDSPNDKKHNPNSDKLTNLDLVRRNPETWVYLCVSYWHTIHRRFYFPNGEKGTPIL